MMIQRICLFAAILSAGSILAVGRQDAPPKSALKTETVTIAVGDAKVNAYLARPEGDAAAPGILLIHEWWGLNDWVKQQADRFAAQGYVALAPDLYRGEVAKDRDHAHELSRGLADERALGDMKAAFEWLAAQKYTAGRPIGIIGWCMGGGHALKLAIGEPRVACTVVCYGRPVTDEEQLRKIKGPVLGIWGETDRGIEVEPFRKALEKAGVKAAHHVYPGAGHAFLNENNPRGYHKEQAERAWKEIDAFLAANLKKGGGKDKDSSRVPGCTTEKLASAGKISEALGKYIGAHPDEFFVD